MLYNIFRRVSLVHVPFECLRERKPCSTNVYRRPPPLRGPQGKTFEDLRVRHSRASGGGIRVPQGAKFEGLSHALQYFSTSEFVHVPFESLRGQHSRASAVLYNIFRRVSLVHVPFECLRERKPCSTNVYRRSPPLRGPQGKTFESLWVRHSRASGSGNWYVFSKKMKYDLPMPSF
jgi:hypothetical protein